MSSLTELINENIVLIENDKYTCRCGSVIKRQTLKTHLNSKKHLCFQNTKEEEKEKEKEDECNICYNYKKDFYTCKTCKNQYCLLCYEQIKICPFCRCDLMYTKFRYELLKISDQIGQTNDVKKRTELYCKLYEYLIEHKECFKLPQNEQLYCSFKNVLLSNIQNGSKLSLVYYRLIYQ